MGETRCIACQSSCFGVWFTRLSKADGREYTLRRCGTCRSAFVVPRPTAEYLTEYYAGSNSSHAIALDITNDRSSYEKVLSEETAFPNSSVDSERIALTCREMSRGRRFLDIGAGYGFFSRSAIKRGFEVTAVEPTEICRKIFKLMNGFEPIPGMLTDELAQEYSGCFDIVLMSQVLEHIPDLDNILKNLSMLLDTNGIVVIAVPHFGSWLSCAQGRNDMFIVPPEHLNFFSRAGLIALFQRHGFKCRKLHSVSRVNIERVARRIPIPLAGTMLAKSIQAAMSLSDHTGRGMFLNAYFSREDSLRTFAE
jgi:SAM-dependent methyltransferase